MRNQASQHTAKLCQHIKSDLTKPDFICWNLSRKNQGILR